MSSRTLTLWLRLVMLPPILVAAVSGCRSLPHHVDAPCCEDIPRELQKVALPPYVIETPDILLIDAVRVIPLPPYKIGPLDQLLIRAEPVFPNDPIAGIYGVDPDGSVNLGLSYGTVKVADLTIEEAREAIEKQLGTIVKNPSPKVQVALSQARGVQQIRGEHLVRPDGTVSLGTYGSVYVTGLTVEEAKAAIERHLSAFLYKPEVSVDVGSYNSKFYYVITDGGGYGEQVVRVPCVGNETVLDAISQVNGLSAVSSKKRIWIARPAPCGAPEQMLPVDWCGLTRGGRTATNYQVLPGDRVYVQAQPLVTLDTQLARVISPIERLLGVTLLTSTTITSFRNQGNGAFLNNP